ncbi:hypothetical protein GG344DRAFT_80703 [Lentinula edodes]|nr:hypothetical protein GG344DRAFT_80703 [Lentinula edodes]
MDAFQPLHLVPLASDASVAVSQADQLPIVATTPVDLEHDPDYTANTGFFSVISMTLAFIFLA